MPQGTDRPAVTAPLHVQGKRSLLHATKPMGNQRAAGEAGGDRARRGGDPKRDRQSTRWPGFRRRSTSTWRRNAGSGLWRPDPRGKGAGSLASRVDGPSARRRPAKRRGAGLGSLRRPRRALCGGSTPWRWRRARRLLERTTRRRGVPAEMEGRPGSPDAPEGPAGGRAGDPCKPPRPGPRPAPGLRRPKRQAGGRRKRAARSGGGPFRAGRSRSTARGIPQARNGEFTVNIAVNRGTSARRSGLVPRPGPGETYGGLAGDPLRLAAGAANRSSEANPRPAPATADGRGGGGPEPRPTRDRRKIEAFLTDLSGCRAKTIGQLAQSFCLLAGREPDLLPPLRPQTMEWEAPPLPATPVLAVAAGGPVRDGRRRAPDLRHHRASKNPEFVNVGRTF